MQTKYHFSGLSGTYSLTGILGVMDYHLMPYQAASLPVSTSVDTKLCCTRFVGFSKIHYHEFEMTV